MVGITQQDLGAALGLTFQQIQKYERGMNRVGASRLFDISQILAVPVQFFFDDMEPGIADQSPRNRVGMSEIPITYADTNPLASKDARKMLKAFNTIANPLCKRRLVELVRAIAKSE